MLEETFENTKKYKFLKITNFKLVAIIKAKRFKLFLLEWSNKIWRNHKCYNLTTYLKNFQVGTRPYRDTCNVELEFLTPEM